MNRFALAICCAAIAQGHAAPVAADLDKAFASLAAYEDGKDFSGLRTLDAVMHTEPKGSPVMRDIEGRLAPLLGGQATAQAKGEACKFLAIIGTDASLPALAALLADESLAEFACMALTRLEGTAVNKALRDAAPSAKGRAATAIVTLLGDRRDTAALPLLAGIAQSADAGAADAAITALGKLGTPEAAAALAPLRATPRPAALDASLRCALLLGASGKSAESDALCRELLGATNPLQIRRGAFLQRCRLAGDRCADLILPILKEGPADLRSTAAAQIASIPDKAELDKVVAAMPGLPADVQALVLAALGRSRPEWVRPIVEKSARTAESALRLAALAALARVGDHGSVGILTDALARASAAPERAMILGALNQLPGDAVGAAILEAAAKADPGNKADLLSVLADRGVKESLPLFRSCASAAEPELRKAALRGLSYLSGPDSLPGLIDMLVAGAAGPPQPDVEKAIVVLATKIDPPAARTTLLAKSWDSNASAAVRAAIARIFATLATDDALRVLQAALDSADPALRDAAVRALITWPDSRAQASIEKIILTAADEKHRILAIRSLSEVFRKNAGQQVKILGQALAASPSPALVRESLASLAQIRAAAALKLAASQLKNPDLRSDAATAVATIASQLDGAQLAPVKPQIQAALDAADPALRPQLEKALQKIP